MPTPTNERRLPTLGELITATIIILGAVFSFWVNTNVRLAVLEQSNKENIEFKADTKAANKEIIQNLQEIKLSLKDKQDRDGKK